MTGMSIDTLGNRHDSRGRFSGNVRPAADVVLAPHERSSALAWFTDDELAHLRATVNDLLRNGDVESMEAAAEAAWQVAYEYDRRTEARRQQTQVVDDILAPASEGRVPAIPQRA
jgi:hypothetical protein